MLAVGLGLMLAGVPVVQAQTCTVTSAPSAPCTVSFAGFSAGGRFVVSLAPVPTTLVAPASAAAYTSGTTQSGPTATVKANQSWHVSVAGATPTFSFTNTGGNTFANPNKPASDLLWGQASGVYGQNMGTPATLFSGGPTNSSTQALFYKTLWSITRDVPGTYRLTVNVTFSAP